MAYISPEACESGLRLKTSHCDICVTFTQRVPTRCSRRWQVRLWFAKSGGSRVLNPRMDTQEQDLQNSQSIEAGDTRMLQLHSTHTGFRMFSSQLLQNALNIVFVLNIVWYIYNLSQIYLLYFIFMREGCNKFCACSFMWAPISDRYYVSSRQKYRMRFRCTSMRQTLVTDRGRPKQTNTRINWVYWFPVQNQSLLAYPCSLQCGHCARETFDGSVECICIQMHSHR